MFNFDRVFIAGLFRGRGDRHRRCAKEALVIAPWQPGVNLGPAIRFQIDLVLVFGIEIVLMQPGRNLIPYIVKLVLATGHVDKTPHRDDQQFLKQPSVVANLPLFNV